jgi:hypothetical protein
MNVHQYANKLGIFYPLFAFRSVKRTDKKIPHIFSVSVSDYLAEAMQVFIESKNQYTYKLADVL